MPDTNPLLLAWTLPPWSDIRAEHLAPAVDTIIADNRRALVDIIATQSTFPTWDDLVLAVDETDARLAETMAVIALLDLVKQEDASWGAASTYCREAATRYSRDKMGNKPLFELYQQLAQSPIALNFDASRTVVLQKILSRFRLAGINLSEEKQQQLAQINADINLLESLFLTQLDSATSVWTKQVADVAQLDGLPQATQDALALSAQQAGDGGWLLRLDQNTYHQVMTYAEDRALREEYFVAYMTRASDQGPQAGQFDNGPVLELLLASRQEKAELLGFVNFAQLTLERETAGSTAQVDAFLRRQLKQVAPTLDSDAQALKAFALERNIVEIQPWDEAFLAEQLRRRSHAGALKNLKSYFPLDGTLRRLCLFSERLFGIRIVEQTAFSRWHEEVRLFEVSEHEQVIGHIYLDPFHRANGLDYAFTATPKARRMNAEGQVTLPIAVLHGNFTPGNADEPCLLVHQDLRVLFHEFGHCLQHVLTQSPHYSLSGISGLGRDSAEFAGQLFEQWCLSPEFLLWLAAHHETAERLTEQRVDAALAAVHLQTSGPTAQLLMGALFDFELHRCQGDGRSVQQIFEDVQRDIPHLRWPAYCRFANSFDYMVTGYAATFYAYKWSGVLASEAFTRFQQDGIFNAQTGRDFRHACFSQGDSRSLLTALEAFLGRSLQTLFDPL